MPRGKCPLCESPVRVTERTPYARLVCGKCHANLHLNKQGRLRVGDPPLDLDDPLQELKREVEQLVSGFPLRKVVTWLAVFLVVVLVGYNLFGPAERLEPVAMVAAKALAEGDPAALESLAETGTAEDVRRWYDAVRPRLIQYRHQWVGKSEVVQALVGKEDQAQHKGSAVVSIHPDFTGGRDVSLADPASSTSGAESSAAFETITDWSLTRLGRWKLDGRSMVAKLPPTLGSR